MFDTQRPILSTSDMRPWFTGKPNEHTRLPCCRLCIRQHGKRERSIRAGSSDEKNVISWVKNDHLGFEVLYIFRGVVKKYRPDFLIRLANGVTLVLR